MVVVSDPKICRNSRYSKQTYPTDKTGTARDNLTGIFLSFIHKTMTAKTKYPKMKNPK